MLPKAHLTSHSRMSASRWMITPSWLSGSLRSFMYSSSVYSCHLFLISSASVKSLHFCPLLSPSLQELFPCAHACICANSLQSCPSLCDAMDYTLPGSSVHGDSPGKNTGVSCHALLQDLLNSGIKPVSLVSPELAGGLFTTSNTWEAWNNPLVSHL